jgi:GNAT superfamily N-acetyltransferase
LFIGDFMPDMLAKLYTLPLVAPLIEQLAADNIMVRRAIAPETHIVMEWVRRTFAHDAWASECAAAFARQPASCWIAVADNAPIGFACYDATCRNFFGPTGVDPQFRGRRIGQALLLAALHDMASQGYGYAIIGGVGPAEFYAKTVGAVVIPDSSPGMYRGMLHSAVPAASSEDTDDQS